MSMQLLTDNDLFAIFDKLNIVTNTVAHAPLHTVEEARALRDDMPGAHLKNYCSKIKGNLWLVIALQDTKVDLKQLAALLQVQKLSFASPEKLYELLGILPGSVSPFAIINNRNNLIKVVLEAQIIENDSLNFHPLRNYRTTNIKTNDFLQFLSAANHEPNAVRLASGTVQVQI